MSKAGDYLSRVSALLLTSFFVKNNSPHLIIFFFFFAFSMICPANCSGHGVCDYSLTNPTCKCFDKSDRTAGCFKSFSSTPPKVLDNGVLSRGITLAMILPPLVGAIRLIKHV